MLSADDIALYDIACDGVGAGMGVGEADDEDDVITMQDFRSGAGEKVAATMWAAMALRQSGFAAGAADDDGSRPLVPPGCLLPFDVI
jgi:hypothetical protein